MELCVLGLCIAFVFALRLPGLCVGRSRKRETEQANMSKTRYRRRSKMKRRGVEHASQDAIQSRSKMAPRRLENRSKMAPGGLPGASREPKLIFDAFLASLGALLGAPGALLGSSWDLLGRSRALLGRSWGSFWPPGGHFFELFGRYFWRLGPGPSKNTLF